MLIGQLPVHGDDDGRIKEESAWKNGEQRRKGGMSDDDAMAIIISMELKRKGERQFDE